MLDAWGRFADFWANSASVIGLCVSLIGFFVTWAVQWRIRRETRRALEKVAMTFLHESLQQMLWQLAMAKESARKGAWQRVFDSCDNVKHAALRIIGNPHLAAEERAALRANADNLAQVSKYLETYKLAMADPPQSFQPQKREVLEKMTAFLTDIQVRLNATIWEA